MSSESLDRFERIFQQVRRRPAEQRSAFLNAACSGDAELRRALEDLLDAYDQAEAEAFLGVPAPADIVPEGLASPIGDRIENTTIAHYQVLSKLGGGGMGVVYKAKDQRLGRTVALKLLPLHLSTDETAKTRFLQEARAVSALDHPNVCTLYEIGEHGSHLFLAMACYEGETLQERLTRGVFPISEALDYANQIASGLAAAHEAGIVHRDVKPANVMVTEQGLVKLLDFGIAKTHDLSLTKTGATLGTVAYMSPEQARGEEVGHHTDLWSLGVVLYEMLTGTRPFRGDQAQAVIYSILHTEPAPVQTIRPEVPDAVAAVLHRLLAKDREARFTSAREVAQELKRLQAGSTGDSVASLLRVLEGPAALAELVLLPRIEQLAQSGDYETAYELARQAEVHFPGHATLSRLMATVADTLSVFTEPEGASVYLQRFAPDEQGRFPDREFVGTTPLRDLRVARGDYRVYIEKEGFQSRERIASSALNRMEQSFGVSPAVEIRARLFKTEEVPDGTVAVPGGPYRLVGAGAPTDREVVLEDYFIDRYAVTNETYQAFIQAGGYTDRSYWKYSFLKDGAALSWNEAMRHFTDRTGLPGPRNWINQEYPEGKARHPVTCITWYEAAAFAAYAGKRLPTVFEREKAARNGAFTHFEGAVMPWGWTDARRPATHRANFSGSGTVPVDSYPFGISPFGAYGMAGNVKEWCFNEIDDGYACTGGSWEDPMYLFATYGSYAGLYASSTLGFRCACNAPGTTGNQGAVRIDTNRRTPTYEPVDAATFQSFLSHYTYDKQPLQAEIIGRTERADWIREKVRFRGRGDDPVLAYLYLPRRAARPYQCIVYVPSLNVFFEQSVSEQAEWVVGPHIKAGRAALAVVLDGMIEREGTSGRATPDPGSVRYRDQVVRQATELRLGLDYLETRSEIDCERLAYMGFSWGAAERLLFAALDDRFRSVVFIGGGLDAKKGYLAARPEANVIHFAPRIQAPTLMLTGRYDEEHPYDTVALPLYNLLQKPKQLVRVEGGHLPSLEERVPVINRWLDETLGPVTFGSVEHKDRARAGRSVQVRPDQGSARRSSSSRVSALEEGTTSATSPAGGAGSSTPMVGRAAEQARLHACLQEALHGARQVVFVTGEAGLGKTTLVTTFLQEVQASGTALVAQGQCLEHRGTGEPYMPVLEAFGRLCREPEGAPMVTLLERQAPTWLVQMPGLVSTETMATLQHRVLGATRERMLREMVETLEALTAEQPLVLVLEDLHWSDVSTLDLLAHLARRQEPARLLLIGTYRPAYVKAKGHPLHTLVGELTVRGRGQVVSLAALTEPSVSAYLAARFPGADESPGLVPLIHERTEGHPLFMDMMIDAWVGRGVLAEHDGRWTLHADLDALAADVPEHVRQLIDQQIERLDPNDQAVLEAASVAGVTFSAAAVAAGAGCPEEDLETRCTALVRQGWFLRASGTMDWPDGTVSEQYTFIHHLHQEVLYDRVPAARRARLHRQIGARIEAGYGPQAQAHAAELADHFVRGRDAQRAVQYLRLAAEQAFRRNAHQEAIGHLQTGLGILQNQPDSPERAQAELAFQSALGTALIMTKGWAADEAEQAFTRARALCEQLEGRPHLIPVLYGLATLYEFRGKYQESQELMEHRLCLEEGDLLLESHELLACSTFHQGKFSVSLDHAQQGLTLFEHHPDRMTPAFAGENPGVACHDWAALDLWFLGYPDQARKEAAQALRLAQAPDLVYSLGHAQMKAAFLYQCLQEPEATAEWAAATVDLATEQGVPYRAGVGMIFKGWAWAVQGKPEEGLSWMRQGLEVHQATGAEMDRPYFLGLLADACRRSGRMEEGQDALSEALSLVQDDRTFFFEAELHRLQGLMLLQNEADPAEAAVHVQRALEVARRQASKTLELRAAVDMARLWCQRGQPEEARALVEPVYGWFTEGFDTLDLQQAKHLLESL